MNMKEELNNVAELLTKQFAQFGEIQPTLMYEDGAGKLAIVVIPGWLNNQKDLVLRMIQHKLKQDNASWYILMSEAWQLHRKNGDLMPAGSFEHEPDREEIIMLTAEERSSPDQLMASMLIIRPEGQPAHLGPLVIKDQDRATGRMVGLLPREAVH